MRPIALAAAILVAGAGFAPAAAAHPADGSNTSQKRQQFTDGISVPVISSPNVRFVTNVPDTAGISGIFAKSAPYFYVSSTDSITVYDVSNPVAPKITGVLPNIVFENEAMNYGEKKVDGVVNRFVLVGVDLVEFTPTVPDHVGRSNEVLVVDVTDPANPHVRSRVATQTNTHTVSCIRETDCQYAYTAGRNGKFSIVDLSDLDNPREVGVFDSPAGGPNAVFTSGAGHKWNFDNAGYGIHTGSGGSAIFDVSNPTAPSLVATTDSNGSTGPWNDFIHHNADRPNASRFVPGTQPSVGKGNVLLVTEEDYENTDCATAGSMQTWHVGSLDGTPGTITPLDRINPVDLGEGVSAPHMAFCSAHWFDYHPSGIVAQGFYEGGLRLIDVRDPRDIKEYGYVASGLSEVWDAYWVPQRNKNGVAGSSKTNIVYTVDAVRGLDVYTVDLPGSATSPPLLGGFGGSAGPDPAVTVLAGGLLGLTGLA
ncbi:MAG: LVIVD repeat-containing protein, partial [Actinomycetes bacterium]